MSHTLATLKIRYTFLKYVSQYIFLGGKKIRWACEAASAIVISLSYIEP